MKTEAMIGLGVLGFLLLQGMKSTGSKVPPSQNQTFPPQGKTGYQASGFGFGIQPNALSGNPNGGLTSYGSGIGVAMIGAPFGPTSQRQPRTPNPPLMQAPGGSGSQVGSVSNPFAPEASGLGWNAMMPGSSAQRGIGPTMSSMIPGAFPTPTIGPGAFTGQHMSIGGADAIWDGTQWIGPGVSSYANGAGLTLPGVPPLGSAMQPPQAGGFGPASLYNDATSYPTSPLGLATFVPATLGAPMSPSPVYAWMEGDVRYDSGSPTGAYQLVGGEWIVYNQDNINTPSGVSVQATAPNGPSVWADNVGSAGGVFSPNPMIVLTPGQNMFAGYGIGPFSAAQDIARQPVRSPVNVPRGVTQNITSGLVISGVTGGGLSSPPSDASPLFSPTMLSLGMRNGVLPFQAPGAPLSRQAQDGDSGGGGGAVTNL